MDAHDERARELYAQTIDAVGPVNFPGDAPYIGRIAAALRKAAADEREAIMTIVHEWSPDENKVLELIRARAKGGA